MENKFDTSLVETSGQLKVDPELLSRFQEIYRKYTDRTFSIFLPKKLGNYIKILFRSLNEMRTCVLNGK